MIFVMLPAENHNKMSHVRKIYRESDGQRRRKWWGPQIWNFGNTQL